MALDSLSFIAPARLRALLCPLGRIRRSRFSSFVDRLQAASVVRLGDVTPDTQPNRTMFTPQGFPDGQIMWDLSTSVDREHEYLETFELHRRTFAIIAVADHAEINDPALLSQQLDDLKLIYPDALYYVCVMFDAPANAVEHEMFKSKGHPRFLAVPPKPEFKVTSMRTLMCHITSPVLSELVPFAKSLLALPTLESPSSPENRATRNSRDRRNSAPGAGGLAPYGGDMGANRRKSGFPVGTGASIAGERIRFKGKGRSQIAMAQLHMLTGRVPDALKEFVDGADLCRSNSDHLWHGKALEGIGVCLLILANLKVGFHIPTIPYPPLDQAKSSKASPSSSKPSTPNPNLNNGHDSTVHQQVLNILTELHNSITSLYQRSSSFPGESIPHICYCEMVLRYTKVLTSMYLSNGVSVDAVAHIVSGAPIPHKGPKKNFPSRVDISESTMKAYPQPIELMTVLEATRVLSGISSIFGTIGMKRRKALVTRELLKILIPGLIQARVVGAAEMGIHPAAGLSALSGTHGSPLDLGEGDVESGIMDLLEDLCRTYGIFTGIGDDGKIEAGDEDEQPLRPASGIMMSMGTSVWTKTVIAEHELRTFGWPSLKINVLRSCTALCEALPDFQGVLNFTTQLLKTADMDLTRDEQIRLSNTISRTVGAARKLGLAGVQADYWDQYLLRDVELVENTAWKPPIPHSRSELQEPDSLMSPTTAIESERSPFIYNPFKVSESSTTEQILVKGEPAEFRVTLQNPFEFEVEVESVTLDATGVDLQVQTAGVIIAPFRTYQVSVFATPNNTGDVYISGCKAKVYGCKERSFPIFTGGLDPRERETKTKRFGLRAADPRPDRPISTISTGRNSLRPPPVLHPIPKSMWLTVVDAQPLLVVKNTSLSQSALMVLEGEHRMFDITLQNLSNVEVDLLVFTFTDSTTGRIQKALAEKSSSPAERYELELMLEKKRAFVWHRPQPQITSATETNQKRASKLVTTDLPPRKVFIPANGSAVFQIEVLGKPGLTHGTIQADYSHVGLSRAETGNRFYTREVSYPVTVTVNASIELVRVDFIPFSTDFILSPRPEGANGDPNVYGPFKELFSGIGIYDDPAEYCLILLDLRNAWPQPLRIKMEIKDSVSGSWEPAFSSQDVLQAGHTSRIILPVKRIFLTSPYAPIPSLSTLQRQFVVSTTKISVDQERQSREAFWYREELLKRLRGTWTELGTDRTGAIELRGVRLTPRMVETVRVEDIGISLGVGADDAAVQRVSPSKFIVATDQFLTLTTTIINRTQRRIRPIFRLLPAVKNLPAPASFELNRRLAINGLLQQALPCLGPGETKVVETGFVALAKGEYEISASVEEVVVGEGLSEVVEGLDGEGNPLDVLGGTQTGARRCWVCREVCLIVARDLERVEDSEVGTMIGVGGVDGVMKVEAEEADVEEVEEEIEAEVEEEVRSEVEPEKLDPEKGGTEKGGNEKVEAQKVEAQKVEAQKVEAQKGIAEKVEDEAQRVEAEKVEAEKVEAEKVEAEKVEAEKAAKVEAQKAEPDAAKAEPKEVTTEGEKLDEDIAAEIEIKL